MKKTLNQIAIVFLVFSIMTGITGCEATRNANRAQKGAVIGAGSGAVLGAIIGNNVGKGGNGTLGAVIGGVVGGSAGAIIGNQMDKQAQKIEEEIPGAQVERVDDGIVVTFDDNSGVQFDTNMYNITSKSQVTLDKMADILIEYPDTQVLVVGHTDSTGGDELNMNLSKNRAMSVTNYFVERRGLDAGRFTTNWYGKTAPIADNSTAEGRAKNRRVNIAIIPSEKMKNDAIREAGE